MSKSNPNGANNVTSDPREQVMWDINTPVKRTNAWERSVKELQIMMSKQHEKHNHK